MGRGGPRSSIATPCHGSLFAKAFRQGTLVERDEQQDWPQLKTDPHIAKVKKTYLNGLSNLLAGLIMLFIIFYQSATGFRTK